MKWIKAQIERGDKVKLKEDYEYNNHIYGEGLTGEVKAYFDLPEDYEGEEGEDVRVELDSYGDMIEIPVEKVEKVKQASSDSKADVVKQYTPDTYLGTWDG